MSRLAIFEETGRFQAGRQNCPGFIGRPGRRVTCVHVSVCAHQPSHFLKSLLVTYVGSGFLSANHSFSDWGSETVFGQCRERFNSLVYHIAETMRHMITVPPMYNHTLYTVSMVFAGNGTIAVVFSRILYSFQKLVLQLACCLILPLLKQCHRLHFQPVVIYHNQPSFA